VREREGLIARISQLRRLTDVAELPKTLRNEPAPDAVRAIEARVEDVERLVEGLQDSVHRESSRQANRIAELEARIQPGAIGKALSNDATRARSVTRA
jgi:hypothetical protein